MGLFRSEEYRFAMTKRKIGRKEKKRGIIERKKMCLKKKGQIKKGKRRKESKGMKKERSLPHRVEGRVVNELSRPRAMREREEKNFYLSKYVLIGDCEIEAQRLPKRGEPRHPSIPLLADQILTR